MPPETAAAVETKETDETDETDETETLDRERQRETVNGRDAQRSTEGGAGSRRGVLAVNYAHLSSNQPQQGGSAPTLCFACFVLAAVSGLKSLLFSSSLQ